MLDIEELLKYENVELHSFSNIAELTTNLDEYKDIAHYSDDVSQLILEYIVSGIALLSAENYERI